jgi:hypothetical protein
MRSSLHCRVAGQRADRRYWVRKSPTSGVGLARYGEIGFIAGGDGRW